MFNQYPYLNLNDLNLDYILKAIKEMRYEVTNFVSINAIKYADPIQWNITSQYEKNTIVIDPVTGTAYISVAPVPAGVALTRPEYWTVVFDLGSFVTRAAQNFTSRWESNTTTTATFPTNTGEWVVWGDVLYKALVNITAGDTYVIGSNIEHFTIEDLYNSYLNTIASILAMVGDLVDLNTSDKTSIVNAINSVVTQLNSEMNVMRLSVALSENDNTTAVLSHANGSLLWWNNLLYTALIDINIGDTIIDGTNISKVNINDWVRGIQTYILSQLTNEINDVNNEINGVKNELKVTNATTNPKYITVGANYCNFTTINDAIAYAKNYCTLSNRITIVIFAGTYNEKIDLVNNPGIDLLGIGMPTIQADNVTYPDAPLNFSGSMSIEGIEFINLDTNPTTYGIHYEGLQSSDREFNKVVIRNCILTSFNSVALGCGLGKGDVFECYNTRFASYAGGSAIRVHPYPYDNPNTAALLFIGCAFRSGGSFGIDITNERTNNGNPGTSAMSVRFIDCMVDTHNPYIKYTIDSNTNYGYIPTTGEIFLSTESTGNNVLGLNWEIVNNMDRYYRVALPIKPDHVDTSWQRYSGGIDDSNYELYDVTFVDASTLDGTLRTTDNTLDANIYTNVHGSIGVYAIDDLNNTKYDNIMTGLYVHLRFVPHNA